MIFTPDDISPAGPVAGTTHERYAVQCEGVALGSVTITPAGLVNSGISPANYIADRLNMLVLELGSQKLAGSLRDGLPLA